ncbi:MAG: hypothetical protein AAFQ14_03210, partial [Cyanobacteria bacterium J06621_12]
LSRTDILKTPGFKLDAVYLYYPKDITKLNLPRLKNNSSISMINEKVNSKCGDSKYITHHSNSSKEAYK